MPGVFFPWHRHWSVSTTDPMLPAAALFQGAGAFRVRSQLPEAEAPLAFVVVWVVVVMWYDMFSGRFSVKRISTERSTEI